MRVFPPNSTTLLFCNSKQQIYQLAQVSIHQTLKILYWKDTGETYLPNKDYRLTRRSLPLRVTLLRTPFRRIVGWKFQVSVLIHCQDWSHQTRQTHYHLHRRLWTIAQAATESFAIGAIHLFYSATSFFHFQSPVFLASESFFSAITVPLPSACAFCTSSWRCHPRFWPH